MASFIPERTFFSAVDTFVQKHKLFCVDHVIARHENTPLQTLEQVRRCTVWPTLLTRQTVEPFRPREGEVVDIDPEAARSHVRPRRDTGHRYVRFDNQVCYAAISLWM